MMYLSLIDIKKEIDEKNLQNYLKNLLIIYLLII